jgi:hypothetical protein
MARVMTLDGLGQARVSEIRARLDQAGLGWWRQPVGLQGMFDSISPLWLLSGLIAGAWLAGSSKGRALIGRR